MRRVSLYGLENLRVGGAVSGELLARRGEIEETGVTMEMGKVNDGIFRLILSVSEVSQREALPALRAFLGWLQREHLTFENGEVLHLCVISTFNAPVFFRLPQDMGRSLVAVGLGFRISVYRAKE